MLFSIQISKSCFQFPIPLIIFSYFMDQQKTNLLQLPNLSSSKMNDERDEDNSPTMQENTTDNENGFDSIKHTVSKESHIGEDQSKINTFSHRINEKRLKNEEVMESNSSSSENHAKSSQIKQNSNVGEFDEHYVNLKNESSLYLDIIKVLFEKVIKGETTSPINRTISSNSHFYEQISIENLKKYPEILEILLEIDSLDSRKGKSPFLLEMMEQMKVKSPINNKFTDSTTHNSSSLKVGGINGDNNDFPSSENKSSVKNFEEDQNDEPTLKEETTVLDLVTAHILSQYGILTGKSEQKINKRNKITLNTFRRECRITKSYSYSQRWIKMRRFIFSKRYKSICSFRVAQRWKYFN